MPEGRGTHGDAVAQVLHDAGLDPDRAGVLAQAMVVHHPVARRIGVDALAEQLRSHGVPLARADEAAATVLALELSVAGAPFSRVVERLQRDGVEGAVACAYAAASVRRAATATPPSETPLLWAGLGGAGILLALTLLLL